MTVSILTALLKLLKAKDTLANNASPGDWVISSCGLEKVETIIVSVVCIQQSEHADHVTLAHLVRWERTVALVLGNLRSRDVSLTEDNAIGIGSRICYTVLLLLS